METCEAGELPPLILTLRLEEELFAEMDGLRRRHFPAARNFVSAHITLFHHLPGAHEAEIVETLKAASGQGGPIPLVLPTVRFLGRGVALDVISERLERLRANLAAAFEPWLGAQDRQRYRPHVTVQNKVDPVVARALFEDLNTSWRPCEGVGEGLRLWRYLGGPWEQAAEFTFAT